MLDFELLEENAEVFRTEYQNGKPFQCVVIDNFLSDDGLDELCVEELMQNQSSDELSSDFIFASNKIENPNLKGISPALAKLKGELLSEEFQKFIQYITGKNVFLDPTFAGGGLHQGMRGSYLDMHADFTRHPVNRDWVRELNLLLYLNRGWEPSFGGCLDLHNKTTGEKRSIDPVENRMVIMLTKEHTIHGYKKISFPEDKMRTSVAAYGYVHDDGCAEVRYRSTQWYPDSWGRRLVSSVSNLVVPIKQKVFGSRTARRATETDDMDHE